MSSHSGKKKNPDRDNERLVFTKKCSNSIFGKPQRWKPILTKFHEFRFIKSKVDMVYTYINFNLLF